MEKLPLLVLAKPVKTKREKGISKFFSIHTPSEKRQKERLGSKFDSLEETLNTPVSDKTISDDTKGIYPDQTLVFELAQPRQNFKKAAEKLGLIWLGEDDLELVNDADFYDAGKPTLPVAGRLYLTSPNESSLRELLHLWKLYTQNKILPDGFLEWKDAFSHLKDIRRWGAKDRLPNETISFLQSFQQTNEKVLHLEVEAIFYGEPVKDKKTSRQLENALKEAKAKVLDQVIIEEIRYHAMLIAIPRSEIPRLQSLESAILKIEQIGYVRPQSLSSSGEPVDEAITNVDGSYLPSELSEPVAALLDGIPIQNHNLLRGRLVVNDPENFESISPVSTRRHGTAMASLILHGDISHNAPPLSKKLYIHCLLSASKDSSQETTPKNKLLIGLVNSAIKEMKEGINGEAPTGKNVTIVNLSLGDTNRPFTGQMSAWARLIDYLSWKHSLLFIVSAGNVNDPLFLDGHSKLATVKSLSKKDRQTAFIKSLEQNFVSRTIFSPAEAINALTIGAAHSDGSAIIPTSLLVDPYDCEGFPSVISGMGLGYRNAVKPDVLHAGGRAMCTYAISSGKLSFAAGQAGKYFGQKVASASAVDATTQIIGTSNSAALVTRAAIQTIQMLEELQEENKGLVIGVKHLPCMVKALIVHSAKWGGAGDLLESIIEPQHSKKWLRRRKNITRLMGYGSLELDRVLTCTEHRVTLLGTGEISVDGGEIFEFPLPPSISSRKDVRRLTVTMAWLCPLRPGEQLYRSALLEFSPADDSGFPIGVKRSSVNQPPGDLTHRGTVVHEIYEGKDAVPISDGNKLRIKVECRSQGVGGSKSIPYAIAVTFEVADTLKANIYQEISSRIGIRPTPRVVVRNRST